MLGEPETQAKLQKISTLADWRTPSELRNAIEEDFKHYGVLLPAIGIRAED